jgi:hypothetical protein
MTSILVTISSDPSIPVTSYSTLRQGRPLHVSFVDVTLDTVAVPVISELKATFCNELNPASLPFVVS